MEHMMKRIAMVLCAAVCMMAAAVGFSEESAAGGLASRYATNGSINPTYAYVTLDTSCIFVGEESTFHFHFGGFTPVRYEYQMKWFLNETWEFEDEEELSTDKGFFTYSPKKTNGEYSVIVKAYDSNDDYVQIQSSYFPVVARSVTDPETSVYCAARRVINEVVTPGMTDLEKCIVLHDWICKNNTYTESAVHGQMAEGVLIDHQAVCNGIAKAYQMLLQECGIDCVLPGDKTGAHKWALVQLDNKWYHVDCTWDDVEDTSGDPPYIKHELFLMTDEETRTYENHDWNQHGDDFANEWMVPASAETSPKITVSSEDELLGLVIDHQGDMDSVEEFCVDLSFAKNTDTDYRDSIQSRIAERYTIAGYQVYIRRSSPELKGQLYYIKLTKPANTGSFWSNCDGINFEALNGKQDDNPDDDSNTFVNAHGNTQYRMAHNIYCNPVLGGSGKYSGFLIDFKADYAPISSYWQLFGWDMDWSKLKNPVAKGYPGASAYAGLQKANNNGELVDKRIMSIWDVEHGENNQRVITEARLIYPGDAQPPEIQHHEEADYPLGEGWFNRYLPEGERAQWAQGNWYRLYLGNYENQKDAGSSTTVVEMWIKDLDGRGDWKRMCAFDTGLSGTSFIRWDQFLENFSGAADSSGWHMSNYTRTFEFQNLYYREKGNAPDDWTPVNKVAICADSGKYELYEGQSTYNKKGSIAFGYDKTTKTIYGATNGYGADSYDSAKHDWKTYKISPTDAADYPLEAGVDFSAGESGGNAYWKLDSDGVLTVSGKGPIPDYRNVVNPELDQYAPWYEQRENITGIRIGEGITRIGNGAFLGCSQADFITGASGVKSVGDEAFKGCSSLRSIRSILNSSNLRSIGNSAFFMCTGLQGSIVIPDSVTELGGNAFGCCGGITMVTVGSGISELKPNVFLGCENLQSVAIRGAGSIGRWAFVECTNLKYISFPRSLTSIADEAFYGDNAISDVYYAGTQEDRASMTIGGNNGNLQSAVWHYSTADIMACGECSESVVWTLSAGGVLTVSGEGAMPDYSGSAEYETPWYDFRDLVKSVVIGDGITHIGALAFRRVAAGHVTIGGGIKTIGDYAFHDCPNLEEVVLPEGVESIGECAFDACKGLKQAALPDSLTTIGNYAFMGSGLTSIVIPGGVADFGNQVFSNCTDLTSANIGTGLSEIPLRLFSGCSKLQRVFIPKSVLYVRLGAFDACSGLTDVYYVGSEEEKQSLIENTEEYNNCLINANWHLNGIADTGEAGEGLTWTLYMSGTLQISGTGTMEDYDLREEGTGFAPWYSYRDMITKVIVDVGVSHVGDFAFFNLFEAKEVAIGSSAASIGRGAFAGCRRMDGVTLPNGLEEIAQNLFEACDALSFITIPDRVQTIKPEAFKGCGKLRSVTLSNTVTEIGNDAFADCAELSDVYYFGTFHDREGIGIGTGNEFFENAEWHYFESETTWTLENGVLTISGNGEFSFTYSSDYHITHEHYDTHWGYQDYDLYLPIYDWTGLKNDVTKVIITGEITTISNFAFYEFPNLESVEIRSSVTTIGSHAFEGCPKLTEIDIPDSVRTIGMHAFLGCSAMTEVKMGQGVQRIDKDAFAWCTGLTRVSIGGSAAGIAAWCGIDFYDEYSNPLVYAKKLYAGDQLITELPIPGTVTAIGDYAFFGCSSLTEVAAAGSVTSGLHSFTGCTGLTDSDGFVTVCGTVYGYHGNSAEVAVPLNVTHIEEGVFSGAAQITELTLPFIGSSRDALAGALGYIFGSAPYDGGVQTVQGRTDSVSYCIPESLKKVTLTDASRVPDYAFQNCRGLTEIRMPESVTDIGICAFRSCSGLTEIEIPGSVTNIGASAFYGCSGLTEVEIPDSVTNIGASAFCGCSGLESIRLPFTGASRTEENTDNSKFAYIFDRVPGTLRQVVLTDTERIPEKAFYGCNSLTEIVIPESVTSIGISAFENCSALTGVMIPGGVTAIGNSAFFNCSALTEIEIPGGVTAIGNSSFANCSGLTELTIPAGVTTIGKSAFSGCSGLTQLTIEEGITDIGQWAFSNCGALPEAVVPQSVTTIGQAAFAGCSALESLTLPFVGASRTAQTGKEALFGYLFGEVNSAANESTQQRYYPDEGRLSYAYYQIPAGLRHVFLTDTDQIPDNAFSGCSFLTAVETPEHLASIGGYAFYNCSGLTELQIPDGVAGIGASAFSGCGGLTGITIPDSVTGIGESAFSGCGSLAGITIPDGVTGIGAHAFSGCGSLTEITIPDSVSAIGGSVLEACVSLESITLPFLGPERTDARDIGFLFGGAAPGGLRQINLTNALTIADGSFSGCSGLTGITISEGAADIGASAFSGCSGLTAIAIPASAATIGASAFEGCSGLTEITIPDGVTGIGENALQSCSALENLSLPFVGASRTDHKDLSYFFGSWDGIPDALRHVTLTSASQIPERAFWSSDGLTGVTISGGVTSIGDYAFGSCSALSEVTIPDGVTDIGNHAFDGCGSLTGITIPDSVRRIGSFAFNYCSGLTGIVIPADVESIGQDVLHGCAAIEGITLPYLGSSRTEAGEIAYAFGRDMYGKPALPSGLRSVVLTNAAQLCERAFYDCGGLTEIRIPDGVTAIGDYAFYRCSGLTALDIPDGVTDIGEFAFGDCSGLRRITIPDSVTDVGASAFDSCGSLEKAVLSEHMTAVPEFMFYSCTALKEIAIPEGVASVEASAFFGCESLSGVTMPVSVGSIKEFAFGYCESLKDVYYLGGESDREAISVLEDGNGYLLDAVWHYCKIACVAVSEDTLKIVGEGPMTKEDLADAAKTVSSVILSSGITAVGDGAFDGFTNLSALTLPESVARIGAGAFGDCTALAGVFYGGTAEELLDIEIKSGNDPLKCLWHCLPGADRSRLRNVLILPSALKQLGTSAFLGNTSARAALLPGDVTVDGDPGIMLILEDAAAE